MLSFHNVALSQGTKQLFSNANFAFANNMRVGIVGRNGCGKSSLFKAILGEIDITAGEIFIQNNTTISYIRQEITNLNVCAIDYVLTGDSELAAINAQLQEAEIANDHHKIIELHNKIADIDGYNANFRAAKILAGLGFAETEHNKLLTEFSGGWRMRLNIARCLMERSSLLLLDEPTNHLDLETIYWLEKWLVKYTGCLLVIAHDREFLDIVATKILHIEHNKIKVYGGNYSTFEMQRAQDIRLQTAMYNKQQAKIAHMMDFVNRFKAKATKAKQAQSRLKAIAKLEQIALAKMDSPFSFEFLEPPAQPSPLVRLYKAKVGYSNDDQGTIIKKVNFNIETGARIGLLGRNGAGKSTLIKTIMGYLNVLEGEITIHNKTKIGYFHQHAIDYLDLDKTPLQVFTEIAGSASMAQIRNFLAGFNFCGDTVQQQIKVFSGGEKSRLVLAMIVWQRPNLLLLDEPTNHLDLDMRESLTIALQGFAGAVILVSHDQHLLQTNVDTLFVIHNKTLQEFQGDVQDYLQQYFKELSKAR